MNWSVHLFNGTEFSPSPGLEATLAEKARVIQTLQDGAAKATGDEKIVCITQFQSELDHLTVGQAIELLESEVKVFEPVGRKAVIVRLPICIWRPE